MMSFTSILLSSFLVLSSGISTKEPDSLQVARKDWDQLTAEKQEFDKKIESLKKENAELKSTNTRKQINLLKSQIDSLNRQIHVLGDSVTNLNRINEGKDRELDKLRLSQEAMVAEFRKMARTGCLEKLLQDIDIADATSNLTLFRLFSDSGEEMRELCKAMERRIADATLLQDSKAALFSTFDARATSTLADSLRVLQDNTPDGPDREDIDETRKSLRLYSLRLSAFQDAIRFFDRKLKNRPASMVMDQAPLVVEDIERDDQFITILRENPWLNQQYDLYYNYLIQDGLLDNPVKELIMNLKTE